MPMYLTCPNCDKEFRIKPSQAHYRKFCSKKCQGEGLRNKITKKCIVCDVSFETYDNKWRKDAKFCSKSCEFQYKRGENHPNWLKDREGIKMREKERQKKYVVNNRERIRERLRASKLKRREVEGFHSFQDWITLLKEYENRCFYCNDKMTKYVGPKQRTRDHIIPLAKGGTDDIDNIVPACRSCNSSKGIKLQGDFLRK